MTMFFVFLVIFGVKFILEEMEYHSYMEEYRRRHSTDYEILNYPVSKQASMEQTALYYVARTGQEPENVDWNEIEFKG